ncbi:3-hydroxyisobutyrate dehydrogenase [Radiomyces spectabilis]|uniref:3-hydroxyisobutyrate dehydrogenase n=1 Tax=Radiomyces spectabilis TaxID=64574 RepID=UPI00221F30B5|nr:3-hydroxyisobutyrate dehydrogenase [Radiomyces spectabilis]KAI8388003.1 3-hydroxyisobutyrate dehydrogenase [Radiomyces spectabilis]
MDRQTAIGFIGLGQMGHGMAKNLAEKSKRELYIYDVNPGAVERFSKEYPGVKPASCPEEIAEKASTVITMLPESQHVQNVYQSLSKTIDESSVLIDSSTIEASVARELAENVMSKKAKAFDAPVSGGIIGAEAGTLTFMVGAPSLEGFGAVKPILEWMGRNVVYCGDNGTGQVAKLCNNMLLGISMIGVSEAMLLGTRLGMDPHLLASIINASSGRCWSSDTYNPHPGVIPGAPATRNYTGGFSNKLMAKDLRLAMKAAQQASNNPTLGATAAQIYNELAVTKDFDSLDFSSVYQVNSHNPQGKKTKACFGH